MYKLANLIIKLIDFVSCKVLFRTKYVNAEILQNFDKCLVCPNHSRIFDPAFIDPSVSDMYSVAKSDLFENKFCAYLLKAHNAVPIKRNSTDVMGVKSIINLINEKDKIRLLFFPEGGIYKENYLDNMRKVKNGAVYIAATANVPIIPVYITSRPRFFSKVTLTFGKPFYPSPDVVNDRKLLKSESKRLINYIYDINTSKKSNQ